jgi:hypothetical protein
VAVDGNTAWVTSPGDGAVYLLQEGTAEPIGKIDAAPDIFDLALEEGSAWVTSESEDGTLWRIDRATYAATRVGKFPGVDAAEVAFGSLWLSSRQTSQVWKVDLRDGSILGQIKLLEPAGLAAAGDALWISLLGGELVVLDPATLAIRSEERLPYGFYGSPVYAFGSLWVSALEQDVVLRVGVE